MQSCIDLFVSVMSFFVFLMIGMSTLTSGIVITAISISVLWADFCIIRYTVQFVVSSVKNKSLLCCKNSIVLILYITQLDFREILHVHSSQKIRTARMLSLQPRVRNLHADFLNIQHMCLHQHSVVFSIFLFITGILHVISFQSRNLVEILKHKVITANEQQS